MSTGRFDKLSDRKECPRFDKLSDRNLRRSLSDLSRSLSLSKGITARFDKLSDRKGGSATETRLVETCRGSRLVAEEGRRALEHLEHAGTHVADVFLDGGLDRVVVLRDDRRCEHEVLLRARLEAGLQ